MLIDLARRDNLTIRQLYLRIAGARGHQQVVGTPQSVADQLQQWFEEDGADGFNIMSPWLPGGLDDFIELALPELRRRGLFRTEYSGATLRQHLGLARPAHRAVAAASASAASARPPRCETTGRPCGTWPRPRPWPGVRQPAPGRYHSRS